MNPTNEKIPDDEGLHKSGGSPVAVEEAPEADDTPIPQTNDGNNARASWPISTNNLRNNISHMRVESKQAIVDCFLWCIHNDITRAEFAKAIGTTDITIYRIITGRYLHPTTGVRLDISEKMLKAMLAWLEEQKPKGNSRTEFVLTPTAKKVWLTCDLARESCTPAFLFGASHIGKTVALEEYARTHNHGRTIYVRIGAASGLRGLLKEIAKSVGVSDGQNNAAMLESIIRALAPNMLLILDEVHELLHTYRKESFFACIEVIREIYDRVGCGMVLSLTKIKWEEISQYRRNDLEQMFRRGVHRTALGTTKGQPLKADIEVVLRSRGLDFPDRKALVEVDGITEQPYDILVQLSKDDGLKSICERLRYARKLAVRDGRDNVTWADFVTAHIVIKRNGMEAPEWN